MTKLNPNWIDVEHKPLILDGEPVFAGLLEDEGAEAEAYGVAWPSQLQIYSGPDEWRQKLSELKRDFGTEQPLRTLLYAHNDQSPESSCVFNATECAYRSQWVRNLGLQFELKWSPMWGYQFNCSGRHSGSYTMDAMKWSETVGLCPESSSARSSNRRLDLCHARAKALCRHTYHQNTPYRGRNQYEEARATAKHFRITKRLRIESEDQYASAILHRLGIVNGRSGHSIFQGTLIDNGGRNGFHSGYLDSYDTDRGDDGWLYDSRRAWRWSGAWAPLEITLPANPIFPCGDDTLRVSLEEYKTLYPNLSDDQLRFYYELGPTGTAA